MVPNRRQFLTMIAYLGISRGGFDSFINRSDSSNEQVFRLPIRSEINPSILYRTIDKKHPIDPKEIENIIQPELIRLPLSTGGILVSHENVRIHNAIHSQLKSLFSESNTTRTGLFIHSGFRSYEEQAIAYSLSDDKRYVLKPGESQHHSGLALDFTSSEIGKLVDAGLNFQSTKAGKWLLENAWQFGFVPGYINRHDGIMDEPWHYVFIGPILSKIYHDLKEAGWYGDVFTLQNAVNLGMQQIVIDSRNP